MKTYRLSAAGRRMTLLLMLAALLLIVFALYMLQGALGIRYSAFRSTLRAATTQGLGPAQLIPAGILLTMLVAAPLLLWSLWEEWSTSYTVADDGLTYRTTPGIALKYPWTAVKALRGADEDDAILELVVEPSPDARIRNPLQRWLHRQAFGRGRVPIYPGVAGRDELLAEIVERTGLARPVAMEEASRPPKTTGSAPAS
jgi:hypothetical protein